MPDPSIDSSHELSRLTDAYEWRKVIVEHHNEVTNKFRIVTIESGKTYDVPRIYLMFSGENLEKFAKRIQQAIHLRNQCESKLKFEALVDGIDLSEFPQPPKHFQDNIRQRLTHYKNLHSGWIEIMEKEQTILYQRHFAALDLIKNLRNQPHSFPFIELQIKDESKLKMLTMHERIDGKWQEKFKKSRQHFRMLWLHCCPETIKIMEFINNECHDVSEMSLFHVHKPSVVFSLPEFCDVHYAKLEAITLKFLKTKWIEKIVYEIRYQLMNVGKGWFDLNVENWAIYKMSKLRRMIEVIRHRMEISIRVMLKSSLEGYFDYVTQPCHCLLNVPSNFIWNDNLLVSPFITSHAVFTLNLNIGATEPNYSANIDEFGNEIIQIVQYGMLKTHEIPQIDPYLVTRLKFDMGLRLSSIGILDDEIQQKIQLTKYCYEQCTIPLRAYAKKYEMFLELRNLNVSDYIRTMKLRNMMPSDIKEEILIQQNFIRQLKVTVPVNIQIGPFLINVSLLRQNLIIKRKEMFKKLLLMLTDMTKEKMEAINAQFDSIYTRLMEKNRTIEQLNNTRIWMPKIPEQLRSIDVELKRNLLYFDVLDDFHVSLPNDIFKLKWNTKQMPQIIQPQISETEKRHAIDVERFKMLHESDVAQFLERIEMFQNEVEIYSTKSDFYDLSDVSLGIEKLWNALMEQTSHGAILNERQVIFNQAEIDMESLNNLIERLHPHHILWTMASNFLQSKDHWAQMPLSSIDVDIMSTEVDRCKDILRISRQRFSQNAEMLNLIENIANEISACDVWHHVMIDLKNPNFHADHWTLLIQRSGLVMKYNANVTFEFLIAKGILRSVDVIRQISNDATREYEQRHRAEVEAEMKRLKDEEIMKQKQVRRLARKDI